MGYERIGTALGACVHCGQDLHIVHDPFAHIAGLGFVPRVVHVLHTSDPSWSTTGWETCDPRLVTRTRPRLRATPRT